MNFVYESGRITSNVELQMTRDGVPVLHFTIAVFDENDKIEFLPCIAWERVASYISAKFNKGDAIGIVGSIKRRAGFAKQWLLDVNVTGVVDIDQNIKIPPTTEHEEPIGRVDKYVEKEVPF